MQEPIDVEAMSIGMVEDSDGNKLGVVLMIGEEGEHKYIMQPRVALGLINIMAKGLDAVGKMGERRIEAATSSIVTPGGKAAGRLS